MQPTLCSRCKKNVAVIFISKLEGGETKNEGLCLKCAAQLGLPQVEDMMKRMGITPDDLENLNSEMMQAFGGAEELGDVLMQVVFHAQIEREAGHFTFAEVCDGVCRKLLDRHPHIFRGDESIKDWDSLKNKEKGRLTLADDLESVPGALPALMRAAKLQKRAARCGVETAAAPADIAAAAETAVSAADKAAAEQAVGELLFTAAALARQAGVDPEQALQKRNAAFLAEHAGRAENQES